MKVLKFGGTSVANTSSIKKTLKIIEERASKEPVAVVVSALGGLTNLLIKTAELASKNDKNYSHNIPIIKQRHIEVVTSLLSNNEQKPVLDTVNKLINNLEALLEGVFLINELSECSKDKIVSQGELLSSYILSEVLKSKKLDALRCNAQDIIITDTNYGHAVVDFKRTNTNIKKYFAKNTHQIVILPGFVAKSKKGKPTTLGRGGSDFTAAIIAAALDSSVLEIWTDVSGMFTANPKLVKQAKPIKQISYQEAMELSHFGAKVIYPPTIHPVLQKNIPILIKNTFSPDDEGTLITRNSSKNKYLAKGISHIENISLLTLEGSGMVGVPSIAKRFLGALANPNINITLITQASSEHSICIGIHEDDAKLAKKVADEAFAFEIARHRIKPVIIENNLAIVAVVGDNMKNHQGISGKMFSALGKNNVNIRAIAQGASEKNISAVISKSDVKKALNTLHDAFFEGHIKQLNLFIAGVGNVGSQLVEQIAKQTNYLKENAFLNLRIIGITNSRTMIFNEEGLSLKSWQKDLSKGQKADLDTFYKKVKSLNLRNSIFIDNTATAKVSNYYANYLKESIAVVTCNKIACSSSLKNYKTLKNLAREYNAPFLFETNVGAGLPVINTLNNLVDSGDKITKIQAVLSGSLNFIFNNFTADKKFVDVVKQAGEEGYTEPDPRIDLSGIDVMRKILILARESGYALELETIENKSFLPESSLKAESIEDFYTSLDKENEHFKRLSAQAEEKNRQLKYVAEFNAGKAQVSLQEVDARHPFYNLEGKDNCVLFYSERYPEQPLMVKGAGAGAAVTASGIFADIIRVGRK
jgi:bifunctional aspartokinase / homoserine dehydrogenase 1